MLFSNSNEVRFDDNGRLLNFAVSEVIVNETVRNKQDSDKNPLLSPTNPHNQMIRKRKKTLRSVEKADTIQKIRAYNSGIRGDNLDNPYVDRSRVVINNGFYPYESDSTPYSASNTDKKDDSGWGNAATLMGMGLAASGLGLGAYAIGRMRGIGRLSSTVRQPSYPPNPVNVHIQPTNNVQPTINPVMTQNLRESRPSNTVPKGNPPTNPTVISDSTQTVPNTRRNRQKTKPVSKPKLPAAMKRI